MNEKLDILYKCPDVRTIEMFRLRCRGRVFKRMSEMETSRRVLDYKPDGMGGVGKPKLRWLHGIRMD